jgi:restriction system protein
VPRRSKSSILDDLVELPWWVSVVVAAIAFLGLMIVVPAVFSTSVILRPMGEAVRQFAWLLALFLLVPAPIAAFRQYRRKKLLDAQADLTSIRRLSWQEFEKLIAEWFHRIGYTVSEQGGSSADGGIDLIATRPNEKILVQCKHWRSRMVAVAVARELYGVMMAEGATGGALVTSGSFSDDAVAFAARKSIQLIDGRKLEELVLGVRTNAVADQSHALSDVAGVCPDCGASMVKRTARKGKNAGRQFWGCIRYPACRGTQRLG